MNEVIIKYNETIQEIKSRFVQIKNLQREIINLQSENKARELDKKQAVFEMVVENINKGEIIQFDAKLGRQGGLHPKDKVRIVRKNKKSVTVDIFNRRWDRGLGTYVYDDNTKQKRIPSRVFGEWVFNNPQFKQMIERNEKLKELLGDE